mgnify:CR=1 FL=1
MTSTPTRFEDFDAIGLATLVKEKQVSPLELVDDAIGRIERFDGEVHAVIHRSFERAREHARVGAPGSSTEPPGPSSNADGSAGWAPTHSSACGWGAGLGSPSRSAIAVREPQA